MHTTILRRRVAQWLEVRVTQSWSWVRSYPQHQAFHLSEICEITSFDVVWGHQQRQEQQQLVCAFGADHVHEGNRWKKARL
ncbi:hypothetical protein KIN20_008286 [Parelaphostrongylus tenuis]|uniref:Uncharacterized protein n=1 Tax=Parelaphostrongylus tenuis TaxID=148309 RepID=A0AAD5QHD5_PARTN|nr:hypothetical protein KIN20_008286 [Parelaphostrongylus tenuis]